MDRQPTSFVLVTVHYFFKVLKLLQVQKGLHIAIEYTLVEEAIVFIDGDRVEQLRRDWFQ